MNTHGATPREWTWSGYDRGSVGKVRPGQQRFRPAAGVDSLYAGQTRLETPHLMIKYQPSKESTFWRT